MSDITTVLGRHDDQGMYLVKKVDEHRYDVVQNSSEVIVASAAGEDIANTAAAGINACAIIPRMPGMELGLYKTLCELNRFIFLEGYTAANAAVAHADKMIRAYELANPDKAIDHSKSIFD